MDQPMLTKDNGETVPLEVGCVFAGQRGHYIGQAVIREAYELGWDNPEALEAADQYDMSYFEETWKYGDVWQDLVDEAEKYLNDHTTGAVWGWWDGEYWLQTTDWWDEADPV